jgi:pantoate--beta-alanine ligase
MRHARLALCGSVGFVPTMGYLHEGHLALVRQARAENDAIMVSIFVNPSQFGPQEDYERYPRDEARDLALLEEEGVNLVLIPSAQQMHPQRFAAWVEVTGPLTERLDGTARPGHFRGVATVVLKLFNIVQPQRAYFGRKDAQQLQVIRRMVADLDLPVEIVSCPTVREPDGLALSSRNTYLSPQERQAATVLWRALSRTQELFQQGERDAEALRRAIARVIASEPMARPDYISVADAETLEELTTIEGPALASLAVRIGATRLIDNMTLAVGS